MVQEKIASFQLNILLYILLYRCFSFDLLTLCEQKSYIEQASDIKIEEGD